MPESQWKIAVVFFSLFFLSIDCSAASGEQGIRWSLGPEIYHSAYEEPGIMKEEGLMYGLKGTLALRHVFPGPLTMLGAEVSYARGDQDYTSEFTGNIDDIETVVFEVRGLLGHDVHVQDIILTPYTGIGYRWKKGNAEGLVSTEGALYYDRVSNYTYTPLGIALLADLENGWSIGAKLEYDLFWDGTQKSMLSELHPLNTDLVNDQDDGYGIRASLCIAGELDKRFQIVVEPFWRYWDIGQSKLGEYDEYNDFFGRAVRITGYEPENSTSEYGVNIRLHF